MANNVDERIVAAKFDSSDFEKGVNKTVKKLDELKKSLNMKDTGKSLAEFASETEKGVEKANNALDRLTDRLTTFKGMIKQQITSSLANEISQVFTSITRGISGFISSISSQQVSAGMNKYNEIMTSVRTMTAAGQSQEDAYKAIKRLGEYSDQTSYSLSQMSSGMSKLVAAGMGIDDAEKSMEGLANMAASAGVNIYDAQRAFTNFTQAYSSGSMRLNDWMSFESLNMATENVMKVFMEAGEQAGTLKKDKSGKYKTQKTKTNKKITGGKNVATTGFRDSLKYGWLDKETMKYATATLSYFEDLGVDLNTLSDEDLEKFATKAFQAAKEARSFADVMGTVKDVVATGWAESFEHIFGKLDEAQKFFTKLSESNLASIIYDVGEFRNKVLKAWGEPFDITEEGGGGLFRKGNTGRDLLFNGKDITKYGKPFDLYKYNRLREISPDAAEQYLKASEDTVVHINSIYENIDELAGSIRNTIQDLFPDEFDEKLGRTMSFAERIGLKLHDITEGARDATANILDFFTVEERGVDKEERRVLRSEFSERLKNIKEGVEGVLGVFSKVRNIFNQTIGKVLVALKPVYLGLGDIAAKVLKPFEELDNNKGFFDNITNAVDNLLKLAQPFIDRMQPVLSFLGDVASFFVSMAIDTVTANIELISEGLGLLIELFGGKSAQQANDGVGVLEKWQQSFQNFADTCKNGLASIKEFFELIFGNIEEAIGIKNESGEWPEGGFFKGVQEFFSTNKFVQKIKELPSNIIRAINGFDQSKYEELLQVDPTGYAAEQYKRSFGTTLDSIIDSIKDSLKAWPKKIGDIAKKNEFVQKIKELPANIIRAINGFDQSKYEELLQVDPTGYAAEQYKRSFGATLDSIIDSIKDSLKAWPKKIGDIAKKAWKTIDEFLFGKKVSTVIGKDAKTGHNLYDPNVTKRIKSGFSKWLSTTAQAIKDWFANIPDTLKDLWTTITDFIFGKKVSNTVVDPKTGEETTIVTRIKEGFSEWLSSTALKVWEWIQQIPDKIKGLWKKVVSYFFDPQTAPDDADTSTVANDSRYAKIRNGILTWITNTKNKITEWLPTVPGQIKNMWKSVVEFFFGEETSPDSVSTETETTKSRAEQIKEAITNWVIDTATTVKDWVINASDTAKKTVKTLWTDVLDMIFGKASDSENAGFDQSVYDALVIHGGQQTADQYKRSFEEESNPIVAGAEKALRFIGEKVGGLFTNLPTYIAEGFNTKAGYFTELMNHVTNWINTNTEEVAKGGKSFFEQTGEEIQKAIDGKSDNPFFNAVVSIGTTIRDIVTKTIPEFLTAAWNFVSRGGEEGGWWNALKNVLGLPDFDWTDIQKGAEHIGQQIGSYIEQIPDMISSAADSLSSILHKQESPLDRAKRDIKKMFTGKNGEIIDKDAYDQAIRHAEGTISDAPEDVGLVPAIKRIGNSLKDAFINLGPDMLNGLKSAIDWFSKKMSGMAYWINDAHHKGKTIDEAVADKIQGTEGEDNALWKAIEGIGESIKNFITKTIPEFVQSAVDEVRMQIPKILGQLFGTSSNEVEKEVADFDQNVYDTMVKGGDKETAEQYKKQTQKNNNHNWFIDTFFSGAEAEGAEEFVNTFDGYVGMITDSLDETEKLVKRKDKIAALQERQKTLDGILVEADSDSDAHKSAEDEYDKIQRQIDALELLDDEWVDLSKIDTFKDEGTNKGFVGGILGFFNMFKELTEKVTAIGTSPMGQFTMLILGIGFALKQVKETLSVTDELEAFGDNAKWAGVKYAILGIVGIIGWLSYLASQPDADDPKGKLQTTLNSLDTLCTFAERIVNAMSILAGIKTAGSLFEMIGSIFDAKEDATSGNFLTTLAGNTVEGIAEAGGTLLAIDALRISLENLFEGVSAIFIGIGEGIDSFMDFFKPAIEKMAALSENLDKAISVIDKVGTLLYKFYDMIGLIGISAADSDKDIQNFMTVANLLGEEGTESLAFLGSELEKRAMFMSNLTSMMNRFAESILKFEQIKKPMKQVRRMLKVVKSDEFIAFVEEAIKVIYNGLAKSFGSSMQTIDLNNMTIGFEMLGDALAVFGNGIADLTEDNVKGLSDTLNVFTKLAEAFTETGGQPSALEEWIFGDRSLAKYGTEIKKFGSSINSFFTYIKSISGANEAEYDKVKKSTDLVLQVAQNMGTVANKLATYGGLDSIDVFGEKLPNFALYLGEFINNINGKIGQNIDLQRVRIITEGTKSLAELMKGIGALANVAPEDVPELFGAFMKTVADNLVGEMGDHRYLYSKGYLAGSDLDAGLAEGLNAATLAIEAAEALAQKVADKFTFKMEINSPSRLFLRYGVNLVRGLANGLNETKDAVDAAEDLSDDVSESMTPELDTSTGGSFFDKLKLAFAVGDAIGAAKEEVDANSPFEIFKTLGRYLNEGLKQGIESYAYEPIQAVSDMMDKVVENTKTIISTIKDLILEDMDFSPKITPVLDLTNVQTGIDTMNHWLSGDMTYGFNPYTSSRFAQNLDINRMSDLNNQNETDFTWVQESINSVNERIDTLGDRIKDMQVVLNTGVIAGEITDIIDRNLGRRGFYAGRGGSV